LIPSAATHAAPVQTGTSPPQGATSFATELPAGLPPTQNWWPRRLLENAPAGAGPGWPATTGFGVVPLADMVVRVTLKDGTAVDLTEAVGVTSTTYAYGFVFLMLAAFYYFAWRLWRGRGGMEDGSVRPVLWMISGSDGYPSLSQFQIMLWTATVAASAAFVMILSGNLVDLSTGTLSLLGISGGAALLARVKTKQPTGSARAVARDPATPMRWSDLVVVDGSVDVTRVQMLVFTLVSAAFVVIKVVATDEIPDIPPNFVLLMGLSNGVYATARRLPDS
jgi:hypothetical protein